MNLSQALIQPNRILVIDDDPAELFAMARILTKAGFMVEQANSGEHALVKAREFMPDLILLDVVMPGMDGYEVCRLIKKDPLLKEMFVILLSSFQKTPEYQVKGLDAGADSFIARPYDAQEFMARVRSMIRIIAVEKQLRIKQQWLRVTMTSIGDGLIVTDAAGQIAYLNPKAEALTKWSAEQARGKDIEKVFKIIDEVTDQPVQNPVKKAIKAKTIIELGNNVSLIQKNHGRISIADSAAPIRNQADDIIGGVLVFRDITEKKKTEKQMTEAVKNWDALFNSMEQMSLIIDPFHGILEANEITLKLTGLTHPEIVGKKCFEILHGTSQPPKNCPMVKTLKSGIQEKSTQDWVKIPGEFLVSCTPVLDAQGKIEKVIHISTDISALKQTEKNLETSKQEKKTLESLLRQSQKFEALGTLAGGIAHDFNNILSPIIGLSELLLEDLVPDSSAHEDVQGILKAGNRGKKLVQQILAFSRQSEYKILPVRIPSILKEVLTLMRATIPANIEITQKIDPGCDLVLIDPTQLHQIAMNLLTNAFHAVEKTSGKISVQLTETLLTNEDLAGTGLEPGRFARLLVSDTGCGIDPAIMDRIFDPYFTTKSEGKGTGLGLAVVYGIIKDHKGHVTVTSEKGKGTRVQVYLPLAEKPSEIHQNDPEANDTHGNERILLVDDDEPIVRLEKQILERLGYHITTQTSSLDAIKVFKETPDAFDLVITDMAMPHMTGDLLSRELMSLRPDIPIILCTGFSEGLSKEKTESAGIKGLLMKPIVKSEMAQMVRQVLNKAKAEP